MGKFTAEQRKKWAEKKRKETRAFVDDAFNKLADALRSGDSSTLKVWLTFVGKFHRYSFNNQMLIAMQRPDATHVAGFQAWKRDHSRQVRAGEKAIKILGPIFGKPDPEDPDARKRLVGYRTLNVFDVAQTDGEDLPQFAGWTGDPGDARERLVKFAADNGIAVLWEPVPGASASVLGASLDAKVWVRPDLDPAQSFAVLAHELAHGLIHQTKVAKAEERPSRTVRELEAEAVSFAVASFAGLESNGASADYCKLYNADAELLAASLKRIRDTACAMVAALAA
jgi:hypothetical protein